MLSVNELNEIELIKAQNVRLIEQNRQLQEELQPFKDNYFKSLDNKTIAELAKKSIRITLENRRLENCLKEIKNFCNAFDGSNPDVKEVLRLVKYKISKAESEG